MDRIKMGNYLTELRKQKDLSQNDLAEIIGVTFQAVSKWERGEAIPDIAILERLSTFYNISIDEIIRGESIVKSEDLQQEIEVNEEFSFLQQKRCFGFWLSLAYLILFLLIGICPFAQPNNGSLSPNYYQIVFSSYYNLGNVFLLFQFLTTIATVAITMLFYVCNNKRSFSILHTTRLVLIIINLVTIVYNVVVLFGNFAVGNFLLMIVIFLFDILFICLKNNRKKYILQDFTK